MPHPRPTEDSRARRSAAIAETADELRLERDGGAAPARTPGGERGQQALRQRFDAGAGPLGAEDGAGGAVPGAVDT